ncbi:hypothetical protein [Sporichthya sp.]|uniref:hypothetical protein n=1 Tax=Sporichthya sp. TaxID=65475 RepID=UPI00179D5683|nr:hypothetical protein [Sporichthya sp.]MBA3743862.1 hypothetical protein [Sporichthya sp.]
MNRALTAAAAAIILFAGLSGCGDDDDDPAVETTPVVTTTPAGGGSEPLSGEDLECKDEIVRQMSDPSQETDDVPPECEGVSEDRIPDLAEIAGDEVEKASAKPTS